MRVLSHVVFGALAATLLLLCGNVVLHAFALVGKPFVGFSLTEEGLVNPVGLQGWGAGPAGMQMWDRVVAVDGELVFSQAEIRNRALKHAPGEAAIYQLEGSAGDQRFASVPVRIFTASDFIKSHTSHALLGFIFVVIAVLLYFLRPGTAEAWSFFFLFGSLGVCLASVVDLTLLWELPPIFPVLAPFLGTEGIVLVGVLTRAYSRAEGARTLEGSPEVGEPGFVPVERRRPQRRIWLLTGVCLAISAALSFALMHNRGATSRYIVIDGVLYAWLAACTIVCMAMLALGYLRGKSPRRRARLRQIMWAWPVGAGIPIANLLLGQVFRLSPLSLIWNGFLLLVPISTADAIVRHDLLRLNRTARRLVGGLTVAAVVGMALGFVLWAAVQFLKLDDASAMIALAALLFAVAAPLTHRVQSHIEGLLHASRYDAAQLVAQFTAKASTSTHLPDVLSTLADTLNKSLKPQAFALFRFDRARNLLVPETGGTPLDVDATLTSWLEHADAIVVDDEQPAPPTLKNAALGVRLAVANEPVGLLVVDQRVDQTPYEGGDVSFFTSLQGPLSAALTNTLAFDAVERMNRQLEARVATRTEELQQKNRELALLNTRKDELVATVSHDFRSPLAVIRQNVQTMLRDLKSLETDDLRMFLEGVLRQEDRLTALCTNLLDLARLRQQEGPREPVAMDDAAQRLVDELRARAEQGAVTLQLHVQPDAPTVVRGDRDRLFQVLQNLLDNAIKFTPRGGSISVTLARDTQAAGTALLVEVKDTGCGVPADALPRLFEPFFQVPRTSHAGQGSGLGLAIVRAVVEAHHGTIAVTSEEGVGTRFRLTLPAEEPARVLTSSMLPASSPKTLEGTP